MLAKASQGIRPVLAARAEGPTNEEVAIRAKGEIGVVAGIGEISQLARNRGVQGDAEARAVFECLCDGVSKRREIAKRLGTSVEAVTAARKRLERKVGEYGNRIRGNGADGS